MFAHTFAICAYGDSPYLEACIKSLKRQTVSTKIILCTSTPSPYLQALSEIFELPLFVRDGASDIQDDWNFACHMADTPLVTVAHQDDRYHKDYVKYLKTCWERYPDMTVFTTDCVILKGDEAEKPGMIQFIKWILRMPLRFHSLADRTWVKKAALLFGNPIICPSCTYRKDRLGEPLFHSPFKFALDWDMMWKFASLPGRFVCVEKRLIYYRIHEESATKACIQDQRRRRDETAMYEKIWPKPVVCVLMFFYKLAYRAYD